MSRKRKLTIKQQAFADFYIELGNAYQAAKKAGYSENYAKGNVVKLLENVSVKSYIEKRMEELKTERVADQQEILEFLTAVIRGEVAEPVPVLDGNGKQKVVNLQPSVQTRRAAAVDLGKRYAMWTEKQQIEVDGAVQFIDDISDDNAN